MDWLRLKHVGRYLRGCGRAVISYPFQDEPESLTAVSDATWADDLVKTVASAALGMIQRQALGKVRHMDTACLYVQILAADKTLGYGEIGGAANLAGMCAKGVTQNKIHRYLTELN